MLQRPKLCIESLYEMVGMNSLNHLNFTNFTRYNIFTRIKYKEIFKLQAPNIFNFNLLYFTILLYLGNTLGKKIYIARVRAEQTVLINSIPLQYYKTILT